MVTDGVVHHIRTAQAVVTALVLVIIIIVVKSEQVSRLVNIGRSVDFETAYSRIDVLSRRIVVRIVCVARILVHKIKSRKEVITEVEIVVLRVVAIVLCVGSDVCPIDAFIVQRRRSIVGRVVHYGRGIDDPNCVQYAVVVVVVNGKIDLRCNPRHNFFKNDCVTGKINSFFFASYGFGICFIIRRIVFCRVNALDIKRHIEIAIRRSLIVCLDALPTRIGRRAVERLAQVVELRVCDCVIAELHGYDKTMICAF